MQSKLMIAGGQLLIPYPKFDVPIPREVYVKPPFPYVYTFSILHFNNPCSFSKTNPIYTAWVHIAGHASFTYVAYILDFNLK